MCFLILFFVISPSETKNRFLFRNDNLDLTGKVITQCQMTNDSDKCQFLSFSGNRLSKKGHMFSSPNNIGTQLYEHMFVSQ